MVKPPRTRHSRTRKDPVTIEIEPGAVSRLKEDRGSDETTAERPSAEVAPGLQEEAERPAETVETPESSVSEPDQPKLDEQEPGDRAAVDHPDEASRSTGSDAAATGRAESQERAAPANDTPPVAAQNRGGRGFSAVAAGILGGIVALAGAGGLQYAGLLPTPGAAGNASTDVSGMQAEIASLKDQLAGIQ